MDRKTAMKVKKLVEEWQADLEWGSHHLTNHASCEFARRYPRLTKAIQALEAEANRRFPNLND